MNRVIALALLVIGVQCFAFSATVPEIDAASAGSAVALLSGLAVVIRGRRR